MIKRCLMINRLINIVKLLALALTNLVLELANLVNNLIKPSLNLDKSGPEVDTIIKQTTTPPPPPDNF